MRLRNLGWTRQVLMSVAVTASLVHSAFGQDSIAVPPAPAADLGESGGSSAVNSTARQCQPYQTCPQSPGPCQYYEPEPCCRQSWWARCKAKKQAKCLGYPEEFEEIPFGSLTNGLIQQPVVRGHQSRMAIYHYDFIKGTEQLNSAGRRRVSRLAGMVQSGWGPLIIEESTDQELDQQRRAAVLQELSLVCPVASVDSVVVGFPIGAGLNGVEGRAIYHSLMNQTGSRGVGAVSRGGGFTPSSNSSSSSSNSSLGAGS